MRASHKWLCELSGVDADADECAARLTGAGLEVERLEPRGVLGDQVVIAEVRGVRPHPSRERLSLVAVDDGREPREIVCGAPNVPSAGGKVILAGLGASLPGGLTVTPKTIGGVESRGMLCSEVELDVGTDDGGILVVPEGSKVGTMAADALGLRDTVLEIGLTPNRPDCLGHVGLARELALLFERPFERQALQRPTRFTEGEFVSDGAARFDTTTLYQKESPGEPTLSAIDGAEVPRSVGVTIEDGERCPRYGATVVLGLNVAPSPFWLRYRLHILGLRARSNLVDATNLVLLETGHPIHGFDLASLRGGQIVVRRARPGESLTTLDETQRALEPDDLVICDAEGPAAIAGIMGGANTEIRDDTRHVLVECAYFEPRGIRRTSRRLGLHTDASHRFERGMDPQAIPHVLARATSLLAELGNGHVVRFGLDVVAQKRSPTTISLRPERMSALIGTKVPEATSRRILEGIGCQIQTDETAPGKNAAHRSWSIEAPSWRPDLGREVDLIEEVCRIHGYDRIPTVIPRVRPRAATPPAIAFERTARETAAALGLHEVISYAFVSASELEAARAPTEAVTLENALSEERSVMRTSLLPGLAAATARAQRRQVESVALFELGRTFHPSRESPNDTRSSKALPDEQATFAFIVAGLRPTWIGNADDYDFYDAKGILERLVRIATGFQADFRLSDSLDTAAPWLHPKRRAEITVVRRTVGAVGELHPAVSEALGVNGRPVYAEVSLSELMLAQSQSDLPQARPLPRFPSVTRDLALVVRDAQTAGHVAEFLRAHSDGLVETVTVFDRYLGSPVPDGHQSLAFRLVYRDAEATLTDKKVDEVHQRLVHAAKSEFAATVR